jgi:outer membrane lipoprotein SlyB
VLIALSACATHPSAAPMASAPSTMLTGTILSSRLVMLQIAGAEGGVLGALGAPASAGETLAPATEFIVRETGGTIISVMQPQPTSLRPGERVEILRGLTTRLAPLPANAAT